MIDIIPAIDLIDGKCVRLEQGKFSHKRVYSEEPATVAANFEAVGIKRLHVVDLDGARQGRISNLGAIESIAARTSLIIDVGGGIKTDDDIRSIFEAGAAIANVGSVGVRDPDRLVCWIERYGAEKILLGADVRASKIAIDGWQTETDLDVVAFLSSWKKLGINQAFATDISKDGMLSGPSFDLYLNILREVPGLRVIASGGVRSLDDILRLEATGCSGAIIGKALFEQRIILEDLRQFDDQGKRQRAN